MMKYMSAKEASEKWGISLRRVQVQCQQGMIIGTQRVGRDWLIPVNAKRPEDRRKKSVKIYHENIQKKSVDLILTDLYNTPGTADSIGEQFKDSEERDIYALQLAYYRGNIDEVYHIGIKYLNQSCCFEVQVCTGVMLSLCAMYHGDLLLWQDARHHLASAKCRDQSDEDLLMFWLAVVDCSINGTTTFPKWLKRGDFSPLPVELYPVARYTYIKYLMISGHYAIIEGYGERLAQRQNIEFIPYICEPFICQSRIEGAIVSEIYLCLLCAEAYHNSSHDELAIEHIDRAIRLALPDQLYSPLAEYLRNLDTLMIERLKIIDYDAMIAVKRLNKQLLDGWVKLHNQEVGGSVSLEMTTRELEVAKLAAYGISSNDIAKRMNLSVHTVNHYLKSAREKTGATSREDLIKYL